jgi:hypothetical protein
VKESVLQNILSHHLRDTNLVIETFNVKEKIVKRNQELAFNLPIHRLSAESIISVRNGFDAKLSSTEFNHTPK